MKKLIPMFAFVLLLLPGLCLGDTLRIKGTSVELRAKPDREARVIAYAGEGKEFEIVKTLASGWYSVRLPNDMVVWVERGDDIEVSRTVTAEAPSPKVKAETKKAGKERISAKEKPAAAPPPEQVAKKGKETASGPAVVKPEEAPAPQKKKEAAAAAKAEKAPPSKPAEAGKTEVKEAAQKPKSKAEAAGEKAPSTETKTVKKRRPAPRFLSTAEMETASALMSKGPLLAVINLIFGALCLFLARRKGRSALVWFALGTYFTIISMVIILIKKKREEPVAARKVLKIVSAVFLIIWLGLVGGLYLFTQTALQDKDAIQSKVNLYTLQIHKGNYKGAYLLLSPDAQRRIPYKRFVKTNETVSGALGGLKLYQLSKFNIGYGNKPTVIVYKGTFEKGQGELTFTMVKEGGLASILKPGDWSITWVETSSPRIQQYIRKQRKAS